LQQILRINLTAACRCLSIMRGNELSGLRSIGCNFMFHLDSSNFDLGMGISLVSGFFLAASRFARAVSRRIAVTRSGLSCPNYPATVNLWSS
jgi:hypothetical protein